MRPYTTTGSPVTIEPSTNSPSRRQQLTRTRKLAPSTHCSFSLSNRRARDATLKVATSESFLVILFSGLLSAVPTTVTWVSNIVHPCLCCPPWTETLG